jgi:1,3-beta-glucan synthase
VIRYAILYFVMLVIFICLIAGPLIAGKYLKFSNIPQNLAQPTGLNRNDTISTETGTAAGTNGGAAQTTDLGGGAAGTLKMMARAALPTGKLLVRNNSWE